MPQPPCIFVHPHLLSVPWLHCGPSCYKAFQGAVSSSRKIPLIQHPHLCNALVTSTLFSRPQLKVTFTGIFKSQQFSFCIYLCNYCMNVYLHSMYELNEGKNYFHFCSSLWLYPQGQSSSKRWIKICWIKWKNGFWAECETYFFILWR